MPIRGPRAPVAFRVRQIRRTGLPRFPSAVLHGTLPPGSRRDPTLRTRRVAVRAGAGACSPGPFSARPQVLDRAPAEAVFLKHLDWIDKVASMACSNHGVWGADAEDFTAWVRMKLMEDDYAVVRRFLGKSEIKTYLASVVVRHFVNFDRTRRGRWRPSAAAVRLGAPAVDLEALVRRDGYTLQQAGEKLRTAGRTTLSDAELARLLDQLPERAPLRPVVGAPAAGLDGTPGASRADERVIEAEVDGRRAEMLGVLGTAMEQLEPEEQLIVKLHFADGHTLADVARALRLDPKPLYRRVERLRLRLRALLEGAGLDGDDVRGLLLDLDTP